MCDDLNSPCGLDFQNGVHELVTCIAHDSRPSSSRFQLLYSRLKDHLDDASYRGPSELEPDGTLSSKALGALADWWNSRWKTDQRDKIILVGVRQVEGMIMFPIISFPIFDYYSCLSKCTIILIVVESSAEKQNGLKLSLDVLLILKLVLHFHRVVSISPRLMGYPFFESLCCIQFSEQSKSLKTACKNA